MSTKMRRVAVPTAVMKGGEKKEGVVKEVRWVWVLVHDIII